TNCTVVANSGHEGGGVEAAWLNSCIVYYNSGPVGSNYSESCTLNYCCTAPMPANGTNNIIAPPKLASLTHLSAASPCRGAGTNGLGVDIDSQPWLRPASIGCDEFIPNGATGSLSLLIEAPYTNAAANFQLAFVALIRRTVN